ncbi:LytTR family two component transcriptional regulator [Mucilaginibacter gracilis]|uniref:LytTR family two component transcriptional regulator n=1 Tax=Mucilaginibacter gracilis TaxID=423350 RepID=A0A495IUU6_9SPHI|nr:LytTR family DNA-binding domain-containing protein [Mucilaginibacter gracilis]RKR80525.1 LytTR family two component transcriptional regulator [Mucilaginibacter gracilis]
MNKLKCLIVDDEPIARDIVANFCAHFDFIEVCKLCENALEARNALQTFKIDFMFVDIQMPVLDGVSFIKTLKNPPYVVFTTAYTDYATQAFDIAACDYLVKPFSLERFVVAIDKISDLLKKTNSESTTLTSPDPEFIFVRGEGKIHKLMLQDIIYIEAKGNYSRIVTEDGDIKCVMSFGQLDGMLTQQKFSRSHRSFLINKSKIKHIEGNIIHIGKYPVPIGSGYRDAFIKAIGLY